MNMAEVFGMLPAQCIAVALSTLTRQISILIVCSIFAVIDVKHVEMGR